MLGRNCSFLQGSATMQPGSGELRETIRNGKPMKVVLRNYRKDGSEFLNELQVFPLRDPNGEVMHYAGIQSDVTCSIQAAQFLAYQAQFDALTGVANRYRFRTASIMPFASLSARLQPVASSCEPVLLTRERLVALIQ